MPSSSWGSGTAIRHREVCTEREELESKMAGACRQLNKAYLPSDDLPNVCTHEELHFLEDKQEEYARQHKVALDEVRVLRVKENHLCKEIADLDIAKKASQNPQDTLALNARLDRKEKEKEQLQEQIKRGEEFAKFAEKRKDNVVESWVMEGFDDVAEQQARARARREAAARQKQAETQRKAKKQSKKAEDDWDSQDDGDERTANERMVGPGDGGPLKFIEIDIRSPADEEWLNDVDEENGNGRHWHQHSTLSARDRMDRMTRTECLKLHASWRRKVHSGLTTELWDWCNEYEDLTRERKGIEETRHLHSLKSAAVVGVTTTGAAKYLHLLRLLACEVIVVEEAAEVLEAHVLTALSNRTKHLVLIGDHMQLRPKVENYDIEKLNLGVSLLERLINLRVPHVMLRVQRRMRPEIFSLTARLYPQIECHPSVAKYPDVEGMSYNCHFFSHTHPEDRNIDMRSPTNPFEVKWVALLADYLVRQGYPSSQITILVPYKGQFFSMRRAIGEKFRVATVDNFQGEENVLIILSLVRSNPENRVGFLKATHRSCVALSRAKHGLFVIGNFELIEQSSNFWRDVCRHMRESSTRNLAIAHYIYLLSNVLSVQCKRHSQVTQIRDLDDFRAVRHGGCNRDCDRRLDCGHRCTRPCHPEDDHARFACREPCMRKGKECRPKPRTCDHPCGNTCAENCGDCKVLVERELNCGHKTRAYCYLPVEVLHCQSPCQRMMPCGHRCPSTCGYPCSASRCRIRVKKPLPGCGHEVILGCHEDPAKVICQVKCEAVLSCGHSCPGTCGTCALDSLGRRSHIPCSLRCERRLVCGHACHGPCARACPPCYIICENVCGHNSRCRKKCGDPCAPCILPCNWECEHHSCKLLCHEPCQRPPCHERCPRLCINRKHACPGLCGERCPTFCPQCDPEKMPEVLLGREDEPDAVYIELACGHAFDYRDLDKWMGVSWLLPEKLPPPPPPSPTLAACNSKQTEASDPMDVDPPSVTLPGTSATAPPVTTMAEVEARLKWNRRTQNSSPLLESLKNCCPPSKKRKTENGSVPAGDEKASGSESDETADDSAADTGDSNSNPQQIQLKKCPKCSVPIRVCNRYNAVIKQTLMDIERVKKITSDKHQLLTKAVRDLQRELQDQLSKVIGIGPCSDVDLKKLALRSQPEKYKLRRFFDLRTLFDRVADRMCHPFTITLEWFDPVRAQADHLLNLHAFRDHLLGKMNIPNPSQSPAMQPPPDHPLVAEARATLGKLDQLLDRFMDSTVTTCRVSRCVYEVALLRMTTDVRLGVLSQRDQKIEPSIMQRLQAVQTRLVKAATHELSVSELKGLEAEVRTVCQLLGAAPTPQELREIHQALQLPAGHWFKCPNGHFFVIDGCGGPTQVAKCHECQAVIGGTDHQLIGGTHTGEIDGSRRPHYQGPTNRFGLE